MYLAVIGILLLILNIHGLPPPIPSQVFPMPLNYSIGNVSMAICPNQPFIITCQMQNNNNNCPDPMNSGINRYQSIIFFAGPAGGNPTPNNNNDDDSDEGSSVSGFAMDSFHQWTGPLELVSLPSTTVKHQHGRRRKQVPHVPITNYATICLSSLTIIIEESLQLSPLVNESYSLSVTNTNTNAVLYANNQWGALRGLESFSQLIIWQGPDIDNGYGYSITNTPITIYDEPRFHYRGVLIDTSFNFLTVSAIMNVLDSMPVMKANVLHWHLTDDPAWPIQSIAYPNFTRGAYASTAIYTVADQEFISQYAWERGVSILLELDGPGHATSFVAGSPDLVEACPGHQTLMDPVGEIDEPDSIYYVLSKLVDEFYTRISARGNINWIHFGGDEVEDYTCWLTSPHVQQWATKIGINGSDPAAIRGAFTYRVEQIGKLKNLTVLFWEETFTGNYNSTSSSIICPWVTPNVGGLAVEKGHDVMIYVGGYLDQWVPPARTDGWYDAYVDYAYEDSLNLLYSFDAVVSTNVSSNLKNKVLGGVASAWGDNVDSSLGPTGMLYPRGLATGEKLWSSAEYTAVFDPTSDIFDLIDARIEHARCKLVQRGVNSPPLGLAGDYGLCWIPKWNPNYVPPNPMEPVQNNDTVNITTGSFAGVILGSAVLGAFVVGMFFKSDIFVRNAIHYMSVSKENLNTDNNNNMDYRVSVPINTETTTNIAPVPMKIHATSKNVSSSTSSSSNRILALDQLRGITMWCMLFVNLYYGYTQLPPFFSHGITYFSGPDLIEPLFHFCVGFALRLVLLKRMGKLYHDKQIFRWDSTLMEEMDLTEHTWKLRWKIFKSVFQVRVIGLIILSMFFTEGWGQFSSWNKINGFGDWITSLVQNNQPYHTLLHIALFTIYTFIPMTMGTKIRIGFLFFTIFLHIVFLATFYFRWIRDYNLDEGGYFGFLGWAIEALVGSFAYDIIAWCNWYDTAHNISTPLLHSSNEQMNADEQEPMIRKEEGSNKTMDNSFSHPVKVWTVNKKRKYSIKLLLIISVGFMVLGYLLSCLGSVLPLTKCYNGERIFFWGGYGADAPCANVIKYGGFFVAPPFYLPDPTINVVTMWTLSQRGGTTSYHVFASGTSLFLFMLLYLVCEEGITVPNWIYNYPWLIKVNQEVFGLHLVPIHQQQQENNVDDNDSDIPHSHRLLLYWQTAEVFGENALAVYLIGDSISDNVGNMLPKDCPAWYFLLWGELLYIGVCYIAALYLRKHKLFLRL